MFIVQLTQIDSSVSFSNRAKKRIMTQPGRFSARPCGGTEAKEVHDESAILLRRREEERDERTLSWDLNLRRPP